LSRPAKPSSRSKSKKGKKAKSTKAASAGADPPVHPGETPIDTNSAIGPDGKSAVGPDVVAGASITAGALSRLDVNPAVKAQIVRALADVLPGRALPAGTAAADRTLSPGSLAVLIPSAAIVAAGLDPDTITPPAPNALWRNGNQQLMVVVSKVRANFSDGLAEIIVPVSCDQTGDVEISVSFVTGTPDRPAGGIATTEDHPRGPAVIVENWAEPLIAYAWQVLITATDAYSNAGGSDLAGRNLITAALAVGAGGVTVTPMARHSFVAGVQ
jgi:hypothetical protein